MSLVEKNNYLSCPESDPGSFMHLVVIFINFLSVETFAFHDLNNFEEFRSVIIHPSTGVGVGHFLLVSGYVFGAGVLHS